MCGTASKFNDFAEERLAIRKRPMSAMPASKKRKNDTPGKFTSLGMQNTSVERLYATECEVEPATHCWPDKRKIKLSRRLPIKILKRLYGAKADLIKAKIKRKKSNDSLPPPPKD